MEREKAGGGGGERRLVHTCEQIPLGFIEYIFGVAKHPAFLWS